MRGRTFSREFKLGVVREIAAGTKRPAQVCREYQIAESLLLRWRREYEERGEEAFTPRQASGEEALESRVAQLERHCGQLSLELSVVKKALERAQSARLGSGTR